MAKVLLIFTLAAFVLTPTKWVIRSSDVKISFNLPKENRSGTLNGLEAEIEFDPLALSESKITAKVAVNSLVTHNSFMTRHILSADYFDSEKYPYFTFISSSIVKTDSGYTAKGALTMKDRTKSVEIPFKFIETDSTGVFKGTMTILCGDFGILSNKENNPRTQTDITIEVPVFRK